VYQASFPAAQPWRSQPASVHNKGPKAPAGGTPGTKKTR